ncbi:MAG TPA: hypothetical protein PLY93_07295 [Turneriella sp.]|nr:hypothetical protein [Turneriella sp.]
MNRPVQLYDAEKQKLTQDMPIEEILAFLEDVQRMTPLETYLTIHREYVQKFGQSTIIDATSKNPFHSANDNG